FRFAKNTDDLFVGKTLLHGDVLMWLMKTLLTSGCINQRGAGQQFYLLKCTFEKVDSLRYSLTVPFTPIFHAARRTFSGPDGARYDTDAR
ncbi:hypothetical protein, partial [Enterobacter bugandensis]|uniref:hypothetical protein n=1 Tax=Enterobacter bugandensis TaxID=881260 RepID=UPI0019D68B6A